MTLMLLILFLMLFLPKVACGFSTVALKAIRVSAVVDEAVTVVNTSLFVAIDAAIVVALVTEAKDKTPFVSNKCADIAAVFFLVITTAIIMMPTKTKTTATATMARTRLFLHDNEEKTSSKYLKCT